MLEGEPRERETYVAKAASLRLEIGGVVGLMERAEISGVSRRFEGGERCQEGSVRRWCQGRTKRGRETGGGESVGVRRIER